MELYKYLFTNKSTGLVRYIYASSKEAAITQYEEDFGTVTKDIEITRGIL